MLMSKYTVVLKNLLDDPETKAKIDKALSTYPLYEKKSKEEHFPSYIPTREELNKKILDHYKYREIGFETVGRFIDELEITMNEIMPYYNQLMATIDLDYDILHNVNYQRIFESTKNGESTDNVTSTTSGTSSSTATDSNETEATINNYNKSVKSSTPQGQLDIANTGIDNVSYADELGFNHDTNTDSANTSGRTESTGTSEVTGSSENKNTNLETEQHTETIKGNYGQVSYQSLIKSYRELIKNVERDIINDRRVVELFMLIY